MRQGTQAFVVVDGEMSIAAPVQKVWPHLINYTTWQVYSVAEHISGPLGAEGEIVLLKKEEGVPAPAYYARTIRIQPNRAIMWKVYPQQITPENDYYGIVDFRLYPEANRTQFWYSSVYEHRLLTDDEDVLANFTAQRSQNLRAVLDVILPKLKRLAEAT